MELLNQISHQLLEAARTSRDWLTSGPELLQRMSVRGCDCATHETRQPVRHC